MENSYYVGVSLPSPARMVNGMPPSEVEIWCEENVGEYGINWGILSGYIYVFKKEEDALMFRLRWLR